MSYLYYFSVFSGYLYYEKLSLQSQVKELTGRIIDLKEFKRILIGFIYS